MAPSNRQTEGSGGAARRAGGEFGQFVVVRGEDGLGTDLVVQVFGDGPRERKAVEGARAAADFVEEDGWW